MTDRVKIQELTFKPMISSSEIAAAVERVAANINRDYAHMEEPPIMICILNGSFIFMSDLCRKLDFCPEISFIKLSSYAGLESSGKVKSLVGLNTSIEGRDVIVVEDIVDSGNTIVHLEELLHELSPRSVKYCTLFLKPESYTKSITIDYVALEIGNEFIVGYGLDYNEQGRNLPDIYVVCGD